MHRQEAEKLLAAFIFGDLDEASRAELAAYLQTDDELRERAADMRMAAKVAADALLDGPEPALSRQRLMYLSRLAAQRKRRLPLSTVRWGALAAGTLLMGILILSFSLPRKSAVRHGPFSLKAYSTSERPVMNMVLEPSLEKERVDRGGGASHVDARDEEVLGKLYVSPSKVAADRYAVDFTGGTSVQLQPQLDGQVSTEPVSSLTTVAPEMPALGGGYVSAVEAGKQTTHDYFLDSDAISLGGVVLHDGHNAFYSAETDRLSWNAVVKNTYESGASVYAYDDMGIAAGQYKADASDQTARQSIGGIYEKVNSGELTSDARREPIALKRVREALTEGEELKKINTSLYDVGFPPAGTPITSVSLDALDAGSPKNGFELAADLAKKPVTPPSVSAQPAEETAKSLQEAIDRAEGANVVKADSSSHRDNILALARKSESGVSESVPPAVAARPDVSTRYDLMTLDAPSQAALQALEGRKELQSATAEGKAVSGPVGKDMAPVDEAARRMPANVAASASDAEEETVNLEVGGRTAASGIENASSRTERFKKAAEVDAGDLPAASRFKVVPVNPWVMTQNDRLSTFGLDVDTASYALCRRYIRGGFLPPAGAVRIEEFINYFDYRYPQRSDPTFAVIAEGAPSPFADPGQDLTLLKIGVKARTVGRDQQKVAHLVFVVDTSASMGQPDRLPLVQQAMDMLVGRLAPVDRVTLITCADEARLHLESTPAGERERIRQAVAAMQPSGTTNLLAGLQLGYAAARRAFVAGTINHVVLCSDGVANVGATEAEAVLNAVAADRKQGITLTCVGVGYGSYNDAFLETLADRGDGSYVFLDSAEQARRVFVEQLAATLHIVAKDARIQVEFNPNRVRRYRLIGYENRDIEDARFRDDTVDAGEVGSGQCSTALYELELTGRASADAADDLGTVFVRFRNADTGQIEEVSSRLGAAVVEKRTVESSPCFYLAAAGARFAELLRGSEHARNGNLQDVLHVVERVNAALPLDRDVRELAALISAAENLPKAP